MKVKGSVVSITALALLSGCGGGASHVSPGGGDSGGSSFQPQIAATARFTVDVSTGNVHVDQLTGRSAGKSRAILSGTSVQFSTDTLFTDGGDAGRKAVKVTMTNNRNEALGVTPDGVTTGYKVIFGPIGAVGSLLTEFRSTTSVSTLAGTGTAGTSDGLATTSQLSTPTGVASDGNGALYVTTKGDNRVRKLSGGYLSTVAGGGSDFTNGTGPTAGFSAPFGIAVNPVDGAIFLSEYGGHRIRRISTTGRVSLVGGTGVASSVNGPGNSATFNYPQGVAVDSSGIIYVADSAGRQVRRIVPTGGDPLLPASYIVSTLAGSGSYGATDGIGTAASFASPQGITVDPKGNVYITDPELNKVRLIQPNGEVTTIAGTFTASWADGPGNTANFSSPRGIAYSNGFLFVSDYSNQMIRVIYQVPGTNPALAANWNVGTIAGSQASLGSTDGSGFSALFFGPLLLAADKNQNLFIPDSNNHKIRKIITPDNLIQLGDPGGSSSIFGSHKYDVKLNNADGLIPNSDSNATGVITTGPTVNNPYLNYPIRVAANASTDPRNWSFTVPNGVTAFQFIVSVETNLENEAPLTASAGTYSRTVSVRTLAGSPAYNPGFVDGTGPIARFSNLKGIAIDQQGVCYVVDTGNNAIRRVAPDGTTTTIAGVIGSGSGYIDGNGLSAKFSNPRGIAATLDGKLLYVADYGNNKIRVIQQTGSTTDATGWTVSTIAGGAAGYSEGPGNTALFTGPSGICIDKNQSNIIVCEAEGQRVRRLQFKGGDPTVSSHWQTTLIAGSTASASPAGAFVDNIGSSARFNLPLAVAINNQGWIYVADSANNNIRTIYVDNTVVSSGSTAAGYADSPSTPQFSGPTGVAVDASGFVYITDNGNQRIRRLGPDGVYTVTGNIGQTFGDGVGAYFYILGGITVDSSGNAYIADSTLVRVAERIITTGAAP